MPTCAKVTAVNGSRRKSVTVMKSSVIMARKKDWKHSSATSFSASETGQTVTALAYQVDYVLDGYVKKAGTNFVLSVGRLIGSQPELKGEQRLRKEDIYWEMPRCYQWDITVNLPEGYRISPEGLERLNVKVENDCGAFIVQATTEDGTLRIKAEKRINHKTEPVANWEKLLEITDAANSYEALSIVFQATINPPTSPTTGY